MTKPTKNVSFPCEIEMAHKIKDEARRKNISSAALVRQAVHEYLKRGDTPAKNIGDESIHRPTLDAAVASVRRHSFLQWITVEGETAGDKVATDLLRDVDP